MAPENDSPELDRAVGAGPLIARLLAQNGEVLAQNTELLTKVASLTGEVQKLLARIAELEAKLGAPPKTPGNSSLPPSSGQKSNAPGSSAQRTPRKSRPGVARKLAEKPDATRDMRPGRCPCGAGLDKAGQQIARAYDHIDIPPIRPVTTRINLWRATCPCCGSRVTAKAPADMPEGSPFGPGITATMVYLHGCHMVGFKRLTEVAQGLFGLTISQGAIANLLARAGAALAPAAERIAAEVRASAVIASDETSARVKGRTWWQWTFGCATAVYHFIAPTRGKCVPIAFLDGVRPLVWLSDRLAAQGTHAERHQYCLAHLIRDAQLAIDHGDLVFAAPFQAWLADACAVGRRRPDMSDAAMAAERKRLEAGLEVLLARPATIAKGRKLQLAIKQEAKDKLLVFLTRRDVEPTNNESERALRPSVIFRKVTNGFRSEWGAKVYADLCSVVGTGLRRGRSALDALRAALAPPSAAVTG